MSRIFVYALISFVIYTIQVAVFPEFFVARIRPDLSLLLIIFIALNEDLPKGAMLSFLLGIMKDSLAGGNPGLFGFCYILLFIIAKILFDRLNPESAPLLVTLAFLGVNLEGAFVVLSLLFAEQTSVNWFHILGSILGQSAATAFICGALLWLVVIIRVKFGIRLPYIGLKYLEDEYECR